MKTPTPLPALEAHKVRQLEVAVSMFNAVITFNGWCFSGPAALDYATVISGFYKGSAFVDVVFRRVNFPECVTIREVEWIEHPNPAAQVTLNGIVNNLRGILSATDLEGLSE